MPTKRVHRDEIDALRKAITRRGDRLVSVVPAGAMFEVTYERADEPPLEVRA